MPSLIVFFVVSSAAAGGWDWQLRHENTSTEVHHCEFPVPKEDLQDRKPVRFTALGYGYYPAIFCRGWYGAFPAPTDALESDTVTLLLFGAPQVIAFDAEALLFGGGAGLSARISLEGPRFGFSVRGMGLSLNHPGDLGNDTVGMANVHVTFAVISDPRGRLRIEAGLASIWAPQASMAGPSVGLSGAVGIAGPVGIEFAAQWTPLPYRQYDIKEALTVPLGSVGLSFGWRTLYLDGLGLLDGVNDHRVYNGPYAGIAFKF